MNNNGIIRADDEALNKLRNALQTAGESYKNNFAKLQNVIEEITSGDIQGNPATDLLNKFRDKEDMFRNIEKTINEAEEYAGEKGTKFASMIGELGEEFR